MFFLPISLSLSLFPFLSFCFHPHYLIARNNYTLYHFPNDSAPRSYSSSSPEAPSSISYASDRHDDGNVRVDHERSQMVDQPMIEEVLLRDIVPVDVVVLAVVVAAAADGETIVLLKFGIEINLIVEPTIVQSSSLLGTVEGFSQAFHGKFPNKHLCFEELVRMLVRIGREGAHGVTERA